MKIIIYLIIAFVFICVSCTNEDIDILDKTTTTTNYEDSEMSQDMWEPKDTINPIYYNGAYYTVRYDSLSDIFYIYE